MNDHLGCILAVAGLVVVGAVIYYVGKGIEIAYTFTGFIFNYVVETVARLFIPV